MRGALLVAGTTSDAGKSVLVAGICRLLARRGVRVAPFKAQNMSNNSVVTPDGGEIGRAQALQAEACGLVPSVRFNPVLLKPGSDHSSQLVVEGRAVATVRAGDYFTRREQLREVVACALEGLRAEYDVVIAEGAGSPAEVNLRGTDLANMALARAARLPVVVVGDIDRGGVLAHLFGTLGVLDPDDQALICGYIVNKFRGDAALLRPGLDRLAELTGRRTLGVVPFADDLWIDAEDSLGSEADALLGRPAAPRGDVWLRVAAVRLPRVSNSTDVEALACEPGVLVRWATEPSRIAESDVVVLPGSKATASDLDWLRRSGLAEAITAHAALGKPVLGICGGYQMLGRRIEDRVESAAGETAGLGLLDLSVTFAPDKILARPTGTAWGEDVTGYEIHHGRVTRNGDDPLIESVHGGAAPEGSRRGAVYGTHWHGLFECDGFRKKWLSRAAAAAGRKGFVVDPDVSVAAVRNSQLDLLADLVDEHVDVDALCRLIDSGVPDGLPTLSSALV